MSELWKNIGMMIGGVLIVGVSHWQTNAKLDDNKIAQDSTMRLHWRAEQLQKDSLRALADAKQNVSDSIAAIKDDLILSKLDNIIAWQKQHQ